MMKIKRVGNHWYPNVAHDSPDEIALDEKVERVLSFLDVDNTGELEFLLWEVHSWMDDGTIQFHDEDIWRWLNSTDVFDIRFYIRDIEYKVSSLLMDLLEDQFKMGFYKNLYSLTLCNM